MLRLDEARAVAATFGAAEMQVRRDHLLSHLLAALSRHLPDQLLFFGGTALARAFIPGGRLSEDVDLIALGDRRDIAASVESVLVRGVRREYPQLRWQPTLTSVRDTEPATLVSPDGLAVRVQLLNDAGVAKWPTRLRKLEQRFSDAPPARLRVPTLPAFAAWKTAAWAERRAARDLFDLWSLAQAGAMTEEAAQLYARLGPTGHPPAGYVFAEPIDEVRWHRELAAQTRLSVTAADALDAVRDAWARSTSV